MSMTQKNCLAFRGSLVLPDRVESGVLLVRHGRIDEFLPLDSPLPPEAAVIEGGEGYIAPGFVDLHCHGGGGADFMDGTADAFRTALQTTVVVTAIRVVP